MIRRTQYCFSFPLMALLLSILLLCVPAWGAEPVVVQLDGSLLTFDQMEPELVDGRTFLPYREMFHALGATVSYEAQTHTAVAVYKDLTVRVPIGTKQVTVEKDGAVQTLEMDVASYVKDGSTYVPVRFMAQALDYLVGWDNDNRTVILAEKSALVEQAMSGHNYSYILAYDAFLQDFQDGIWSVSGTQEQQTILQTESGNQTLLNTQVQYEGILSGDGRKELFLSLESDSKLWYQVQADAMGMTLPELGISSEETYAGLNLELRGSKDTTYIYIQEGIGAARNLPKNQWLSLTNASELVGMDVDTLFPTQTGLDVGEVIGNALDCVELTDRDTAMEQLFRQAESQAESLSNMAFFNNGNHQQTVRWTVDEISNELILEQDENRQIMACTLEQTITTEAGATVVYTTALDAQGMFQTKLTSTQDNLITIYAQAGQYMTTQQIPKIQPPIDAAVTIYPAP